MIDPYILISKRLSGEISPYENNTLTNWRKESRDNEDIYQEMKESWHLIHTSSNWVMPDQEHVWDKISSKITELPTLKMYTRSLLIRVASIAAIFAFIIGLAVTFISPLKFNSSKVEPISVKSAKGQKSEVILPDGTTVWINSESTLTYYTDYNKNNRNVLLTGEAFFDVSQNKQLEFNVFVNNGIKIQVHGTAFNVNAYANNSSMEVTLLEGIVSLSSNNENHKFPKMQLHPNQKIAINKQTFSYDLMECDAEVESIWRLGRLKFERASMSEVIGKIEHWYGVNIHFDEKESGKYYWLTIKTESLKETLELLNKITPIEYSIAGEEVTIKYK